MNRNMWLVIVQSNNLEWYQTINHYCRPIFSYTKNFPIKRNKCSPYKLKTYTQLVNHMLKGLDV